MSGFLSRFVCCQTGSRFPLLYANSSLLPFRPCSSGGVLFAQRKTNMGDLDIQEFIQQNRALADQVETYRGVSESEKHWDARREFLLRNINDYEDPHMDHLLALSMVWANNVFLGCRYSAELLEKVTEMAEGIVVVDAPIFKTRDEIMKKQQGR